MVGPLVDDFMRGKSGMLAALGPSGSGKTHTVFGTPRDPGVVPRILQRIFEPNSDTALEPRRSFSIAIFEIHSERGKGEKLFDLCGNGAELSMQQSTVKGLQEVIVSDARAAESTVAQAMLRRLTAMTNSNSQSSRSQCIINIRSVANNSDEEDDFLANNAVLSIIDLAGAEREKKTGNQGARLLESSFINNTSMVFGLCLRSLLEHQKNPKKPLQKHFQNSLLTRYLRDYLEGKKKMMLILTVKSGEEDYLDTTYLLRQASPFMRIRFDNVEEQANISCNKRLPQALSRREKPKRMRFSVPDISAIEENKVAEDECDAPELGCVKEDIKSDFPDSAPLKLAKSGRSYQILQNFAKALWTVLKQHGKQLKAAEHEIQHLTENLKLERMRNIEMERQLEDLKSSCTCSHKKFIDIALAESATNFNSSLSEIPKLDEVAGLDVNVVDDSPLSVESLQQRYQVTRLDVKVADDSPLSVESSQQRYQGKEEASPSDSKVLECIANGQSSDAPMRSLDVKVVDDSSSLGFESSQRNEVKETSPSGSKDLEYMSNGQVFDAPVKSSDVEVVDGSSFPFEGLQNSRCCETDDICSTADVTDHTLSLQPLVICRDDSHLSVELHNLVGEKDQELLNLPKIGKVDVSSTAVDFEDGNLSRIEKPKESLDPLTLVREDLPVTEDCKVANAPNTKQRVDTPSKPGKPKRRLLPASSALLKDFNTLEIGDKSERPKGNRGGKNVSGDERNRSKGSISLLRMLNSNIQV